MAAVDLARRREFTVDGMSFRTPLLVPSFSSKGFADVQGNLEFASGFIAGPALISCYDLHYGHLEGPFTFPEVMFLDSGGYEASRDFELSDYGEREYEPEQDWSAEKHQAVLDKWNSLSPTVAITYDNPRERLSLADQIARASAMNLPKTSSIKEFLIKPETADQRYIQVKNVVRDIRKMDHFDIIGVTEKELGGSYFERMKNVAAIRIALDNIGAKDKPIHVFGSLDPVSSPLYFLAGADIFDGLTWLRFGFYDGLAVYRQNHAFLKGGINSKVHLVDTQCWSANIYYLDEMQTQMRSFLAHRDFGMFKDHAVRFERAFEALTEEMGG